VCLLKLNVLKENISTGKKKIAVINYKDAEDLDLFPGDRVYLKYKNRSVICILDVAHTTRHVPIGRLMLYKETSDKLNVKNQDFISIAIAKSPPSLNLIKKKLSGSKLSKKEYQIIVDDIVKDNLSEIELTYFVAACSAHNLTIKEVKHLIDAMVSSGQVLRPRPGPIVDKHCVGGVAGNRTTMIVTPILAAAGCIVPKTSSKAITSPAGTANTMSCLANVCLSEKQIEKVLDKVGACIVWGGALNLAPADDQIIRVEHPLSIDVSGLLLSSIMSKKISVSATHLLIDIPWGPGSKFPSKKDAIILKKKFELITKISHIKSKIILSDGRSPIGNGLGPLLEAIDVMKVLENKQDAPQDLRKKSLYIAGELLELANKVPKGKGEVLATFLLDNGSALKKMNEMIKIQGKVKLPKLAKFKKIIRADNNCVVKQIDNKHFSKIAKIAGAPSTLGAGIYIYINVNDKLRKGDKLFTIYSNNTKELNFAHDYYKANKSEFIYIK
jgi:putative thymidine phosphorylase